MGQDFLFQYRGINKYTILNLLNQEFRLNSPKLFNDPYDGRLLIDNELLKNITISAIKDSQYKEGDIEKLFEDDSNNWFIEEEKKIFFNTAVEDSYISCFSAEYKSILMWSHYSDFHKGICIKYNKQDLECLENMNLKNVIYSDEKRDITAEIINQAAYDRKINKINKILEETIFTKSKCWEYENEWRLVYFKDVEEKIGDGFNIKAPKPVAIYMGTNIKCEDRNFIRNLCREREIELYQMQMKKDKVELIEKRVEL